MKAFQLLRFIWDLCSPFGIAEIRRQIPISRGKSYSFSLLFTPMASGEHDNARIRRFDTKRLSGSPSSSDDSQIGQDASDPDCLSSNEYHKRRSSTAEDEQRVKNLLKEILAYRGTNVSSWIVEVCC